MREAAPFTARRKSRLDLLQEAREYIEITGTLDWGQELRESDFPPCHEFIGL